MAFWRTPVDIRQKHQFKLEFVSEDGEAFFDSDIIWYAKSVTRPTAELNTTEYQIGNHKFTYPGVVAWSDVEVVLTDVVDTNGFGTTASKMLDMLKGYGYTTPDENEAAVFGKLQSGRKLGEIHIHQEVAEDEQFILTRWTLHNPYPKTINFGQLDYSSEDEVEITITFAYDYATLLELPFDN